jgi:hypothetical protein
LFEKRQLLADSAEERIKVLFDSAPAQPLFLDNDLPPGQRPEAAKAYQDWIVQPRIPIPIRLDRAFDSAIRTSMSTHFKSAGLGYFLPPAIHGGSHVVRWQGKIVNDQYGALKCARTLQVNSGGGIRYSEKIDRHPSGGESISDLFIASIQLLRFAAEFYEQRDYFAGFTVFQRVTCSSEVRFHANFPDANGNYHGTNVIAFPDELHGKAQGTSKIAEDVDSLSEAQIQALVLDFMLAHLRELCYASIDYQGLKTVLDNIPDRLCCAFF